MELKNYKAELVFGGMFLLLLFSMGMNSGLQSDWGNVIVDTVEIRAANGEKITGKLYKPADVNAANPAPGVLAIHGYNNDKDVQRPHSMEMAKRGIVVLAIDVLNHGDSDENMTVSDFLTSVPLEAYDYIVNGKAALDWVMERQCVKTDKASGIVNDANLYATETVGNASYPLELFQRVITVSLETMEIVNSLPKLDIEVVDE